MSFIQAIPPRHPDRVPAPRRSGWRWFPWALAGCMAFVFAVNAGLVVSALKTFPGQTENDGFAMSNSYAQVLAAAEKQAALGWTLAVGTDESRHPVVRLVDAGGTPIAGATIEAQAQRPVGPPQTTALPFHEAGQGRYMAEMPLIDAGQWDLSIIARANGGSFAATRRVVTR